METHLGSFGTKILSAANTIAPMAGALSGWLSAPMSDGRGLEGAPAWIMGTLNGWKIANPIITTQRALSFENNYHIMTDVVAGLTGLIIKEIGQAISVSEVERMGSALMKFGGSAAANSVIAAWVYEAKYNPHGAEGGPASGAGGAYIPGKSSSTIQVDNPQGLAPMFPGTNQDYGL